MCCLGTWFNGSEYGSAGLMIGFNDLRVLFQSRQFYDSMKRSEWTWSSPSISCSSLAEHSHKASSEVFNVIGQKETPVNSSENLSLSVLI